MSDEAVPFLRHVVATIAYRGGKVVRAAPPSFASFRVSPQTRTPLEVLAHVGDLLDWCVELCDGRRTWREDEPGSWEKQVSRFFDGLARLDERLASGAPPGFPAERIFQGPLADALTHVGQLAMLRRMSGAPVRGENYFVAQIAAGRVGPAQEAPRREFD